MPRRPRPSGPQLDAASAWSPLRLPLFRSLWIATVASNLGTWLQGVGAAWLMTTLAPSPTLVALVQAATSLPMFLLSLPAGALADVYDRRRLLLAAQAWMLVGAALLAAFTLAGWTTPWLLLALTSVLGLGAAINQPAWQAIIPELVPREELGRAVALGSVAFNIARAVGPALGGLLVATAGPAFNFLLNAASFAGVIVVLYRWKRPREESVLPAERVLGAMRTGLRYVRHSPAVLAVIARGAAFVLCASSLWALLPVVARQDLGTGPAGYGLLLAALGAGAVTAAFVLPHLRRGRSTEPLVAVAAIAFAGATLALAWVRSFPLLIAALFLAGGAWMALLSSLNVAIQTLVPAWVRARSLSVYMLFFFGGLTGGSALWGALAERFDTSWSLTASAAGILLGLAATGHLHLPAGEGLDLAPSRQWPAPLVRADLEPERGPVMVLVHFRIDPARADEFRRTMSARRRIRLRDGALQWGLFADSAEDGHYTEVFLVKSWLEHLRQHERLTHADTEVDQAAHTFHLGPGPPRVEHLIGERVPRAPRRPAAP
jgi:MFS family permease